MVEKEKYEGENKNYFKKMTNEEYWVNSPDYRELIIEMVKKIKSQSTLKYIFTIISSYIRSRGI